MKTGILKYKMQSLSLIKRFPLSWKMNMKKILLSLFVITAFLSCKDDSKKENELSRNEVSETTDDSKDGLTTLEGNFVYYADAAVLQTKSELYGVIINEKMHELDNQAQSLKDEPTDQVAVTIKAKISKKPADEEGWENRVEIVEILKVSKLPSEANEVIKLGTNQ